MKRCAFFVCWCAAALCGGAPAIGQQAATTSTRAVSEELAVASRILANEGVLDGYGHVSVRSPANPGRYYLSRSMAPGLVTPADIVEYTLDSVAVTNSAAIGYIERFIHGEIY